MWFFRFYISFLFIYSILFMFLNGTVFIWMLRLDFKCCFITKNEYFNIVHFIPLIRLYTFCCIHFKQYPITEVSLIWQKSVSRMSDIYKQDLKVLRKVKYNFTHFSILFPFLSLSSQCFLILFTVFLSILNFFCSLAVAGRLPKSKFSLLCWFS